MSAERISFSGADVADAQVLSQLMTENISRWVASWPYPLSPKRAHEILLDIGAEAAAGNALPFVVTEQDRGNVIGWLKVSRSDFSPCSWEIGYWIGESYQGRGFAKDITRFAVKTCFTELGAKRVWAGAQVANQISLGLLKKVGFRHSHDQEVFAPARQRLEICAYLMMDKQDWEETGAAP